ncbi:MAG: glycosyltransferase family 4 protein [Planctomycetes bacterium]|nr:glycosyltransferase family 4 protein [Planctomycetota bacterium]
MTKGRVVQFSTVHPPNDIRVFHRECRTLAAAGYDIAYVVPHDRDETVHGVRLCAVRKPKGRLDRMIGSTWRVFRRSMKENGKVYHFHDPELIPAALLMKLSGKRVIYDAHEDTPRSVYNKTYIPKPVRYPAAWLCEFWELLGMWAFDNPIAATPAIARRFPKKKAAVVQNFPIMDEVMHEHATPVSQRLPNVIYVGEISRQRGICEIVRAMSLVPADLDAKLILAGKFVPASLEQEVRAMPGWDRVEFLGWRSRDEILREFGRSRAGLVLFHPVPNHTEAQPAKLFEYMAAGLPLIASNFEHWRTFVEGEGCGIQADPRDPSSVAAAITKLLRDPAESEAMGKRGQRAVRERFNWGVESQTMLGIYERLMAK